MPKSIYILLLFLLLSFTASSQQSISVLRSRLRTESEPAKINTYLEISKIYAADQPDSAVHYCNQAMKLAENLGDRNSQGLLLIELGRINILHHHEELARRFINEALSIFRNLHQPEGITLAYDQLGLLDGQQKNISAATEDFGRSMEFYRDSHDSLGILETYNGLGKVYEEKGDIEKALTYYLRILVQYEQRKLKPEAYFILLDRIGHLYLKKGDSHTALKYLEEGIRNSNTSSERDTQITMLNEEGKIYEQDGQKTHALTYYKQALSEAKKFNRPEEQAQALINIAGVLKKENSTQSLNDLKRALKIADSLRQPRLEATIYAALAGVYQQEKDYKEAMVALEENHRLLDSLLGADTTKEIAAIDSSYALESSREKIGHLQKVTKAEKKELDMGLVILIAILALLVLAYLYLIKIQRLNKELKAANHVKDVLFSVIGHDLKGPAGSAAQLFALMETEDFTEAELKSMISDLRKQTEASFELLQTLFEWGRAQLQGIKVQPEMLDAKSIISKNIYLLSRQAGLKNIIVSDHVPEKTEIIGDLNHFDFIIRNLISNAIKFTYESGHIDLDAQKANGEVIFSVKDTGTGIVPDQQKLFLKSNLQVSYGTKGEKGSGLGLSLIKEFLEANNGRIWLESTPGKGTTFYFSFPGAKQ
ncbi:tetratricopeptide repeat-containing sensor histidine kinase [Mucilaginibacter sp.]|uniref:ATP-binding protein n=1 Tax=Mucilaginibacter sp. TaxID=1882438 RepID=UPI0026234022|nr:tetratricopeptide repeat-containing sensor histidine kinase [Mucilaginibacter sp.]MDB5030017.1 ATP-binding region ATPase domain protein [Mucilaginibacter sp.]